MKCSLLTLSCALDGELSRERQSELDAHLITCERCRTGMRYLREETERISLLAPVRLSDDKATALLERSRVLVPVSGAAATAEPDHSDSGAPARLRVAPDPFGAMGLGAILEIPTQPDPADHAPTEPEEEAREESETADSGPGAADLEHGSAFEAEEADLATSDALATGPETMWLGDAAEDSGTDRATAASDEVAEADPEAATSADLYSQTAADPREDPGAPPIPADMAVAAALGAAPETIWLTDATGDSGTDEATVTSDEVAEDESGLAASADLYSQPAPDPREDPGPPPVPGDVAAADALAAVPEAIWLADAEDEAGAATIAPDEAAEGASEATAGADGYSDAASGSSDRPGPPQLGSESGEARLSSIVVPGWEPATELNMPWGDIPAATPSPNTWAPDLAGVPVLHESPLPPAAPFPAAPPPTRPAASAIPGLQTDRETLPRTPRGEQRRGAGSGIRRPSLPRSGDDGPDSRSWNRTGLIAVAAIAAVLLVWNFTHGSGTPAGSHRPQGRATAATSPHPTPSASAAPSATPTPLALTGVQTVGSTGSGYQIQTVRYGVHGSQFWVVFQMVQGSGAPQVTAGFDGPQTLYVEMQGVAPGTAVPQPTAGTVVSSITVGKVAGFTGAVYVLHLTRAVQLTPSELTGTDSGGAGERYLAILQ